MSMESGSLTALDLRASMRHARLPDAAALVAGVVPRGLAPQATPRALLTAPCARTSWQRVHDVYQLMQPCMQCVVCGYLGSRYVTPSEHYSFPGGA